MPISLGLLPQTTGQGTIAWLDTADLAECAKAIAVDQGHDDAEYELTGPRALSIPDIAAILSMQLGRRVRYVHLTAPLFGLLSPGSTSAAGRSDSSCSAATVRTDRAVAVPVGVRQFIALAEQKSGHQP
ncbi:MAG: hypothetical protein ACR2FG_15970 [Marmoricola sp.]